MAQALCSRTLAAASLASPLRSLNISRRSNVAGLPSLRRVAVSASLEKNDVAELLKKEEMQSTLAGSMAASVFTLLASAPSASAAQLVAELADDNRPIVLFGVLVAALGWVLFNILQPGLRQLDGMTKGTKSVIGAIGLGAAGLLAAQDADAAQLVAEVAEDNRPLVLLLVVLPALGWVLFNILQPALRQLSQLTGAPIGVTKKVTKKGIIGAIGLSGAMAYAADSANAAQEIATLAEDNRPLVLLLVILPALGWVLFNILRPALNQLSKLTGTDYSFPSLKKSKKSK